MSHVDGRSATPAMRQWAIDTFPDIDSCRESPDGRPSRDMVRRVDCHGETLVAEVYTGEIHKSDAITEQVVIANRFEDWPKCFREGQS